MASVTARPPATFDLTCQLVPSDDAGVCPHCRGQTSTMQPDEEDPDRLLEVCEACGEWIYRSRLVDGRVHRFAILAQIDGLTECSPPRPRLRIYQGLAAVDGPG